MPEFTDFEAHPLGKELRKRVSRIIWKMAIFRYSPYALFSAQLQILEDLLALEDSLRSSRDEASSLRKKAGDLAKAELQPAGILPAAVKQQLTELHNDAASYDYAVRLLRYGRWLYRYVADGIAWRAYRYNRQAIRALGAKEPVVFLSRKEGIEREIKFFKDMRRRGRQWLPIMHDLTNCLRTGDFSLFKDGVLYRFIELKIRQSEKPKSIASDMPTSAREERQADRMRRVGQYMQTGNLGLLSKDLHGGKSFKTDAVEKHHYESIAAVVHAARCRRYGFSEPERGILYLASDTCARVEEAAIRDASEHHPHIFNTLFTFQGIIPRFEEYHVSLPITAMHLPARDIVDMLFGRIAVMSFVNFDCVETFCRSNGVPLHFEGHGKETRLVVDSKPYPGEVQEGLWNRLLYEGLSLQSFSDLIKAIMIEAERSAA